MEIFFRKSGPRKSNHAHTSGFTLVETLVVVAIMGILVIGITALFKDIFVDSRQTNASLNGVDQSRLMAANFVNEIRNITYGADGSFPLNQAGTGLGSSNALIFFTTYNTGGTVNRVRYYVSGTTLYKGVIVPSGTPAVYNSASEALYPILANVTNSGTSTPAFYYYDGNYAGPGSESALTQPVNVNTVNFTQLNLNILKEEIAGSTATFAVNDGATLRSLKTNLGN